jgi:hypothetical protein
MFGNANGTGKRLRFLEIGAGIEGGASTDELLIHIYSTPTYTTVGTPFSAIPLAVGSTNTSSIFSATLPAITAPGTPIWGAKATSSLMVRESIKGKVVLLEPPSGLNLILIRMINNAVFDIQFHLTWVEEPS